MWNKWKEFYLPSSLHLKSLVKEEYLFLETINQELVGTIYKKAYSRSAKSNNVSGHFRQAVLDPLVTRGNASINKAYKEYLDPKKAPPLMIRYIDANKGYGVFSVQTIPQNTLLCEYAADILPLNYPTNNDKIMSFGWGDTSEIETQLSAEKTCGIGPIIND